MASRSSGKNILSYRRRRSGSSVAEDNYNFVAHGDSMTNFGTGNYVERFIELVETYRSTEYDITSTVRGVNGASWNYAWPSGDPIISLEDDAAAEIDSAINTNKRNILFLFAGSNGITINSNSAATEYAAFESYLSDRIAAGWSMSNIYVLTMLDRVDVTQGTIDDYNALLVAGAATHGYKIVYAGTDERLRAANRFPEYSMDGVHPTAKGHYVIAQNIYDDFFETRGTADLFWDIHPSSEGVIPAGDDNTVARRMNGSGATRWARSEQSISSGLKYVEVYIIALGTDVGVNIRDSAVGVETDPWTSTGLRMQSNYSQVLGPNSTFTGITSDTFTTGDTIGVLVDMTAETAKFRVNDGAFTSAVDISALTGAVFLGVGLAETSRVRVNQTPTYALPDGATYWV
jgi:hypothetical protein